MSAKKETIVVVGGGGAGNQIAQQLSAKLDPERFTIQLVTERAYNIHLLGCLRMLVTADGELEKRVLTPYDRLFKAGKAGEVVLGRVTKVEDGSVTLEDGRTLHYDYLVLTTGSHWMGPLKFPDTMEETTAWIAAWRKKFHDANSIVLLGGGAVGCELAGEIRHYLPDKRVTIVHNQPYLVNPVYPDKMRIAGTEKARKLGINLVLEDKAELPTQEGYTSITTEKGTKIETDLVIPTFGGKLNTEYLRSFDSQILTPQGAVRVEPTLQVPLTNGKRNVYAAGDIMDWNEQKQLAKTTGQAAIVVANILAQTKGLKPPAQYKGGMEGILMPFGPNHGYGYLPFLWGIVPGDYLTSMIKGKGLFIDAIRKGLGYTS